MKKYLITLCALACGASVYANNYTVNSVPAGTKWSDIQWTLQENTENRDKYYLDLNQGVDDVVVVNGGDNVTLSNGDALYVRNNGTLIIGDAEGETPTEFHLSHDNTKDTFIEICQTAQILINKNGVLTVDGSRGMRFYNATGSAERPNLIVDGGVMNGQVQGSNSWLGSSYIVFKNGATLNRNGEVNPFAAQGKTTVVFDNSTYNLYDNGWTGLTPGWGNHLVNLSNAKDSLDRPTYPTQINFELNNGAVWNGAGDVVENEAVYYDFSSDITSAVQNAKDLSFTFGGLFYNESYVKFSVLNGSKVSFQNFNIGNNDGNIAANASTNGTFNFVIGSDSSENISIMEGKGGTNLSLSRAGITEEPNLFTTNFNMKGNAKYYTLNDFNVGANESTGGTANVGFSGDNNVFRVKDIYLRTGQSVEESHANINLFFGKDIEGNKATNSSFTFGKIEVNPGSDSNIHVVLAGATNTFTMSGGLGVGTSTLIGDSLTIFEITDGAVFTKSSGNPTITINKSGEADIIVSGGATVHTKGFQFKFSNDEQQAEKAPRGYAIADSGSIFMDQGGNVDGSSAKSGEMGFITRGDGSKIVINDQVNVNQDAYSTKKFVIKMEGTNGLFEAKQNLNMNGKILSSKYDADGNAIAGYELTMLGSGNILKTGTSGGGNFNISNENSLDGRYSIYSKSDSADAKNQIILGSGQGEIAIQTTQNGIHSNTEYAITLAGNTVFKRDKDGDPFTFKIFEYSGKTFDGNRGALNIIGSGNELYVNNLQLGNGVMVGGEAVLSITGGGSTIDVKNGLDVKGSAGTSVDNPIGGVLEYHFDGTGISAINLGGNLNASGILVLDFSGLEGDVNREYILMSGKSSNIKISLTSNWIDFDNQIVKDKVKMILQEDAMSTNISYAVEQNQETGTYDFIVRYSSMIPEPSTYAVIFGALALGFAAYRRRK